MLARAIFLCLLLAAAAAQQAANSTQAAQLQTQQAALPPFVEVDSCLPINIAVKPSTGTANYSITLAAEQAVLGALSYNVTNNVLSLESTANFSTNRPIQITVMMPANALQAINHQGTGAEVYVAPGFNLTTFVATTSFGAGRLYVDGMSAQNVSLLSSGTGDVVLTGTYGTINATSTGTGGLYLSGVNDTANLDLRGVSNAFVQPAGPAATITGTAQGINTVQFTDGTCNVASSFMFLQVCQPVAFITTPAANPIWTCGLAAQGAFQCSNQGTAFTSEGGFVGTSGATGTIPITTTTPSGISAFTPSSFQFAGASPAGTGTQQQAGSVTPSGTTAASNVAGTGSVSASSVAGPSGATTSTTQNGQSTGFQTTGQQTSGFGTAAGLGTTGAGGTAGTGTSGTTGGTSSASASSSSSSTAFATAGPSSTVSIASSQPAPQNGQQSAGVIRVGANGQSEATATSQACVALPRELRMAVNGSA